MQIRIASVMVRDQEHALAFYTGILGFVKHADMPVGAGYRWLTVASPEGAEGVQLALEPTGFEPARVYQKTLFDAGIPAAALARSEDLLKSPHLAARGFWDSNDTGVLPGLPWRASFGRATGSAPAMGEHSDEVLSNVLGLTPDRIAELRSKGVLG